MGSQHYKSLKEAIANPAWVVSMKVAVANPTWVVSITSP